MKTTALNIASEGASWIALAGANGDAFNSSKQSNAFVKNVEDLRLAGYIYYPSRSMERIWRLSKFELDVNG